MTDIKTVYLDPRLFLEIQEDANRAIEQIYSGGGVSYCVNWADLKVWEVYRAFNREGEARWILCVDEGHDPGFESLLGDMVSKKWGPTEVRLEW